MELKGIVEEYISELGNVLGALDQVQLKKCVELVALNIKEGRRILICGNGGSAVTASHYYTDWQKMYFLATGNQINCLSLNDNIGIITAYANDISYEEIFSSQIKAVGKKNDLLIVISGSGNSSNIVAALKAGREEGLTTLAVLGYDGGKALPLADHVFHVKSFDMQICEDIHLTFGHLVMKEICNTEVIKNV